jgi:hypothetical protein
MKPTNGFVFPHFVPSRSPPSRMGFAEFFPRASEQK